jgi:hypothetical protein
VEITGGRFHGLDEAVSFAPPPTKRVVKAQLVSNTIYDVKTGLAFHLTPPAPPPAPREPPTGRFDLTIERNYFANVRAIAISGVHPLLGLTSRDNAHGPGANQGSLQVPVWTLTTPVLPTPDPANDATFLRFPGGPPEIPPNNAKVGAP